MSTTGVSTVLAAGAAWSVHQIERGLSKGFEVAKAHPYLTAAAVTVLTGVGFMLMNNLCAESVPLFSSKEEAVAYLEQQTRQWMLDEQGKMGLPFTMKVFEVSYKRSDSEWSDPGKIETIARACRRGIDSLTEKIFLTCNL